MKFLVKTNLSLATEGRWDIDYHLPAEGIKQFPISRIVPLSKYVDVSNKTRDPGRTPTQIFNYVDIASVDVATGTILNVQELTGEEAPSRARMIIRAYDVIVSTVRPTRGATAVIPSWLDNQICSTGFCVLRCKEGVNPYYIHFVLRLESTLEQFRKFSTGSSYPAILDSDVLKTLVPSAMKDEQDQIAKSVMSAYIHREELLQIAQKEMNQAKNRAVLFLKEEEHIPQLDTGRRINGVTIDEIESEKAAIFNRETLFAIPEEVNFEETTELVNVE